MLKALKQTAAEQVFRWRYLRAKRAFEKAAPLTHFLPDTIFEQFVNRYSSIEAKPFQDYSLEAMKKRGSEHAAHLLSLKPSRTRKVLEIGPADGFVLKSLIERGAETAMGVDIEDQLHAEVKAAGVELVRASAEDMSVLKSESFDLVYSWGSFEHILDIRKAFQECLRLLRSGGVLYIEAGPLFFSPWGYHYYSILRIPYIQVLFKPDSLAAYAKKVDHPFPWTSGNPFAKYLELTRDIPPNMSLIDFWHGYDWFSADMITKYPEVFKSKGVPFDDFFIDCVKIAVRKLE